MLYVIEHLESSSNGTDVPVYYFIEAPSLDELKEIVDRFENYGWGSLKDVTVVYDTDQKTLSRHFGAGGSATDFIRAWSDDGDISEDLKDWYGSASEQTRSHSMTTSDFFKQVLKTGIID